MWIEQGFLKEYQFSHLSILQELPQIVPVLNLYYVVWQPLPNLFGYNVSIWIPQHFRVVISYYLMAFDIEYVAPRVECDNRRSLDILFFGVAKTKLSVHIKLKILAVYHQSEP